MILEIAKPTYSPRHIARAAAWSWLTDVIHAQGGHISFDCAVATMTDAALINHMPIPRGPRGYILRRIQCGQLKAVA